MSENTVITLKAREKFAKAHGGAITLPAITQVAYGNGGHDTFNEPIPPTEDMLQVPGEFIRLAIEEAQFPGVATLRVVGTLPYDKGITGKVSACGLYDAEGDLVGIKTFRPIDKDSETAIETIWDEIF